jgi:hypothetical protein
LFKFNRSENLSKEERERSLAVVGNYIGAPMRFLIESLSGKKFGVETDPLDLVSSNAFSSKGFCDKSLKKVNQNTNAFSSEIDKFKHEIQKNEGDKPIPKKLAIESKESILHKIENELINKLGESASHEVLNHSPQVHGGFGENTGLRIKEACSELYHRPNNENRIIAGSGHKTVIKDIDRLTKTYGGTKDDWIKYSSKQIKYNEGELLPERVIKIELHWYENIQTRQKVEIKAKVKNEYFGEKK